MANRNIAEPVKRSDLGMLIRDLGALWQTALKMAIVNELLSAYPHCKWSEPTNVDLHTGKDVCGKYNALIEAAYQYGITDCYTWKHIVDGKRAAQIVGVKPGPIVTELLKIQMTWQLEHPQGTKEECEQAIQTYWQNK
jgi:tRNA nucleotidyltransferase (CCA-adding enzyme)